MCRAGYGSNSQFPSLCLLCPRGSYSVGGLKNNRKPQCTACAGGFTTLGEGATTAAACNVAGEAALRAGCQPLLDQWSTNDEG